MKVISTGRRFEIYQDGLKTYDKLPSKVFAVRFSKMSGYFLEQLEDIEIKEDKIYGVHMSKIQKVLRAFKSFERNLGIILSGDKGIGKSLFARILSTEAIKNDYPVIIIDTYYPGIASFLEDINQEVLVLFDEFDKTFGDVKAGDGDIDPQASLLSLFDGLSHGKKMFVITCNEINKISSYLVNRPGRFHYHFRFKYPTASEVREYLEDKIDKEFYGEIDKVVMFSRKTNLNYDCLRAIAYELNNGERFEDAIADLNILNMQRQSFSVIIRFKNGKQFVANDCSFDMFSQDYESIWMDDHRGRSVLNVKFNPSDAVLDPANYTSIIPGEKLNLYWDDDYDDVKKEEFEDMKTWEADVLIFQKKNMKDMHYFTV